MENYTFWITYKTDNRAFANKLLAQHTQTLSVLNRLEIGNYSQSLKRILLVGIVYSPNTKVPEMDKISFLKKMQKLEIYLNLDYEALLQADEAQTLRLIAQTYLAAISRFLSKRKDFDHQRFYTDVEKLFRENGYL
jgi:Immunity protein 44